MKLLLLNRLKRLNWTAVVQSCWVLFALIISVGQSKAQDFIDPTKPPASVMALLPRDSIQETLTWHLQGLKADGSQSVAIVNGDTIKIGKIYQGYQLTKVTSSQAFFVKSRTDQKVLSLAIESYKAVPKVMNNNSKKTQMRK